LSPFDKLRACPERSEGASSCHSGASAILAVVLALLMGNLAGLGELLREVVLLGGGTLDYNRPLAHFFSSLAAGATMIARGLATPVYDFWAASRVIPNTINEFPFWTFLFADLHPHLIAMPLGMLVVGLALNWITNLPIYQSTRFLVSLRQAQGKLLSTCLLVSLSLGALGATNTWDLPVYFVLVAAAFLVTGWRRGTSFPCWGSSTSEGRSWRAGVGAILAVGAIGALAVAAYWPFYTHYQAQVGNEGGSLFGRFLAPVRAASPLGPWLVVWGFFVFLAFCFVLIELRRRQRIEADKLIEEWESAGAGDASTGAQQGSREAKGRWSLVSLRQAQGKLLSTCLLVLLGITVLLIALDRPTAALLAVPFGLAVCFMFRRRIPAEDAFLFLLLAMGLGVVAGTELFYLRDFLEGSEWYRMNTLFKFGIPAWLFLGLAAGVMLPRVWNVLSRGWAAFGRRPVVATDVREFNSRTSGPAWLRVPWQVITILLLAAGLAFLPLGIPSRVRDRFPGPRPAIGTLDGTAYMTVGRYNWPTPAHPIELAYDYLAIHWLLDHVTGTPVVAEAPAGGYEVAGEEVGYDYYRAGGLRVASLTGFPTFLGQHQFEQRPAEQIWPRAEEGQEFFRTTDLARARELMRDLNVGYVYVGTLERILFPIEGLRKFDALVAQGDLEVAYRNPEVAIYRVVARAEPPL
jgi:YYY domain-containing protein